MTKTMRRIVGGRPLETLVKVERWTVLEHWGGRGFLAGSISLGRAESFYLLVPTLVRTSLKALGLDLNELRKKGRLEPEVTITCDGEGERLMLEYAFPLKKLRNKRK